MQVFIAEDNYYELERLRRQVQSWGSRHGGVSITAVQCVAEVGPADLRTYDAVFLDVELPGKDGFAFAQELRGAGCSADIVFVTNHPELSLKGYTVHAQDYIIKPVEQERIDAAMDYIARNCRLKERRSIVLQRGISQQDRYFLTEILYVEASNPSSIVYTYDKTQSYALTFAQMEKLLPGHGLGMGQIKKTVQKYDGVYSLRLAQPGRFVVDLLLPIDAAAPVEQVFVWESAKEALV